MAARAQRLTATTITVLESAYVEGNAVRLTCGTLAPRKFAQPRAVLQAIGGVWSTATGAYTFPHGADPAALLAAVLEAGTVPLAAKTAEGYVRTPDQVATDILTWHVGVGHLPRGARVLEPSAGDGALVRAILSQNRDVTVVAVEPHPERVGALRVLAATVPGRLEVHAMTLEEFAADPAAHGAPFDAAIMNPPFALPGNPDAWISHVRTAYGLMYPGAQLAAIVPNSYTFHSTPEYRSLRADVDASGGRFVALDRKAFGPSACGVLAGVLTFPKPMPAPADGLPSWLARAPLAGEPVPVRELNPGASGAATMPVQVGWYHGQDGMVLRYAGQCFGCLRLLWTFDHGGGAAVWEDNEITADVAGKVGPAILACLDCVGSDAERYARALAAAAPYWTDKPASAPRIGPKVYPMDVGTGNWVTVTGLDPRGWEFTATGQVIAEPVYVDADDRVTVVVRGKFGVRFELSVHADSHVIVFDGPADGTPAPAVRALPPVVSEPAPAACEPAPAACEPFVSGWTQEALFLPV